jgi:hypothetical protein
MRFLATFLLGLLLLAALAGWRVRQPVTPYWAEFRGEFSHPLLALSFARQTAEVRHLFGLGRDWVPARQRAQFLQHTTHAVRLGGLVGWVLAGFLAVFSLELGALVRLPAVGYLGAALALAGGVLHGQETEHLLGILDRLPAHPATDLRYLTLHAGLKWGSVPLLLGTWLPALWRLGTVSRGLFVAVGTAAVLGTVFFLPWEKPELLEAAVGAYLGVVGALVPYSALLLGAAARSSRPWPTWL